MFADGKDVVVCVGGAQGLRGWLSDCGTVRKVLRKPVNKDGKRARRKKQRKRICNNVEFLAGALLNAGIKNEVQLRGGVVATSLRKSDSAKCASNFLLLLREPVDAIPELTCEFHGKPFHCQQIYQPPARIAQAKDFGGLHGD